MATYSELLNSPEWQKTRLAIINSSRWKCEHCNNQRIDELEKSFFYSAKPYTNSKIAHENLFCFIVNFSDDLLVFSAFHWTRNKNLFDELALSQSSKIFYESVQDHKGTYHNKLVALQNEDDWIYVSNMHVHHKYYQDGLKPWEYPKAALQTLCWSCHEKLHENTYISHRDKNGNEIGKFKTCWKCHGAGYLPEYYYVQSGVCFGCNGGRYNSL